MLSKMHLYIFSVLIVESAFSGTHSYFCVPDRTNDVIFKGELTLLVNRRELKVVNLENFKESSGKPSSKTPPYLDYDKVLYTGFDKQFTDQGTLEVMVSKGMLRGARNGEIKLRKFTGKYYAGNYLCSND